MTKIYQRSLSNLINGSRQSHILKQASESDNKNIAVKTQEILEQIKDLSSKPLLRNFKDDAMELSADKQVLAQLSEDIKPVFTYMDLLVRNLGEYLKPAQTSRKRSPLSEDLLKGVVEVERFLKARLTQAAELMDNPLAEGLLRLTAHDVLISPHFQRISTALNNPQTKNKFLAVKSIWNSIKEPLNRQKELLESFFQRIDNVVNGEIKSTQRLSYKEFLVNLGRTVDLIAVQHGSALDQRLTINNASIIPPLGETHNPFDYTFSKNSFPVTLDAETLKVLLRNIVVNALENSSEQSKLNLEMKVITADGRKKNPIKPHLLIKLSNPIRDYQEFQNKDILENIIQGSQISTKQNPSSTNGTFLKTAKEILTANGGDLSVSVLEKDNLSAALSQNVSVPITEAFNLKKHFSAFGLDLELNSGQRDVDNLRNRIYDISGLLSAMSERRKDFKARIAAEEFLNRCGFSNKSAEFQVTIKFPLEKSSEI